MQKKRKSEEKRVLQKLNREDADVHPEKQSGRTAFGEHDSEMLRAYPEAAAVRKPALSNGEWRQPKRSGCLEHMGNGNYQGIKFVLSRLQKAERPQSLRNTSRLPESATSSTSSREYIDAERRCPTRFRLSSSSNPLAAASWSTVVP